MTDEPPPPPTRAEARKSARARREYKAGVRQVYFQALASGFPIEEIAAIGGVSVRTVRREIDRAIAARRLDAPEAYVHLQVARLTKALRLTDAAIDRGHLRAIVPHMKLVAALDRYHGLSAVEAPPFPNPLAAPPLPAPAAPLQLTRAAPALEENDHSGARTGVSESSMSGQVSAPKALESLACDQKAPGRDEPMRRNGRP